jgi:hypothetical protein
MNKFKLSVPVVFIIFNRPEATLRVFAEIAKSKPSKLFVVADGPRENIPGEGVKCNAARNVINMVNWDCEVVKNYSDINMGCRDRVSSGLDWVFENVNEAIILEDDCLPSTSFFQFCEEMLTLYQSDNRIAMISGNNFQFGNVSSGDSYYFSKYTHIWGWATWKRAWVHYDKRLLLWPKLKKSIFNKSISFNEKRYWIRAFQSVYDGNIDTWDYQWMFAAWANNMLSIVPNVNLIKNIGFGSEATHTKRDSIFANMKTEEIKFPLTHPNFILPSYKEDKFTAEVMFFSSILGSIFRKIKPLYKIVKSRIL